MSFQMPITIAAAIRNIENNHYLLPAIQREFEWKHHKIEWLFDSIMRNYPISSFLFWRVEGSTKSDYKFYQFIKNYQQRHNTHNEEISTASLNDFTAVLDGQQRLTSLYIGLCGTYAYRMPRLHEENSERVYPTRRLYLNIERPLENEEDGRIYEFKFLTDLEFSAAPNRWFKVSEIMALGHDFTFNKFLDTKSYKDSEFAWNALATLKNAIHSMPMVNFFLETEQSLDKALNIFIRINSGGLPLDFSDLIMSIAVANWKNANAREEIHSLVDSVRDKGFGISKDFVLKTFLYLHSNDIKFKVTNFSKNNAIEFEKEWDQIRDAILSVFDLIKTYGLTDVTLTSKNALIPIVYYLYHRRIAKDFHTSIGRSHDREAIKKWLHTVLIKKVFGATSDSVLSQIRSAFTSKVTVTPMAHPDEIFPVDRINASLKRDIGITDEFLDDLLLTQMKDVYAFSVLALLYPNLDYKNNNFHKDHLHPSHRYKDLSETDKTKYGWATYNSLLNLQMLDANENMSKQELELDSWVTSQTATQDRVAFLNNHLIPDTGLELANFSEFIDMRKVILKDRLKTLLS